MPFGIHMLMKTQNSSPFQGWSLYAIAHRMGIPYSTVWRHAFGKRQITAEFALRYEQELGISRSKLRPDLWPPEDGATHTTKQEEPADASH